MMITPMIFNNSNKVPLKSSSETRSTNYQVSKFNCTELPGYSELGSNIVFLGKKVQYSAYSPYQKELDLIDDILIDPLKFSDNDNIPPSLLLGCSDDSTMETILKEVKKRACADVITISEPTGNAISELNKALKNSRNEYLAKGKRTIIVINDAEKIIGIQPVIAKEHSDFEINNEDIKYLESLGNNTRKVNFFKSLLDNVSKIPKEDDADTTRCATTIIFTTKHPHLIHPDLLSRSGKMRMLFFPLIEGEIIKEVIQSEIKKLNDLINSIDSQTNLETSQHFEFLSSEGKKRLQKLKTEGTLNQLNIKNDDVICKKLMDFITKTQDKGTFSVSSYGQIARNALSDYLEEPNIPYSTHFIFNLGIVDREISPEKLKKWKSIEKTLLPKKLSPKEIFELKQKLGLA